MEFITCLEKSHLSSGLARCDLDNLKNVYKKIVGDKEEIDIETFKKFFQSKNVKNAENMLFAERVFKIFDMNDSGSISLDEFMEVMSKFSKESPESKLKYLFEIYDLNDDGTIQLPELRNVINECLRENGLKFENDKVEQLTRLLFDDADVDCSGSITFQEFQDQICRYPGFMENLSFSIERWLLPPKKHQKTEKWFDKFRLRMLDPQYIRNNMTNVIFLITFILINVGLFTYAAVEYRKSNIFIIFARACGQCLNFNCAFVLVLVLRRSLTLLRSNRFAKYLPIDQHIYYHQLTGFFIISFSTVHTIMHICNFAHDEEGRPLWKLLFSTEYGIGWVAGSASLTGWILLLIFCIMFASSMPFVRKRGNFQVFYRLHQLAKLFWLFLILHARRFWMWLIGPAVLYIIETVILIKHHYSNSMKTYIKRGVLLPSEVTHLIIKRPKKFDFQPGDYVYVKIPAIAKYEWHPFTISSAPEKHDVIWLHIRSEGGWTRSLHNFFQRQFKDAVLSHESANQPKGDSISIFPSYQKDAQEESVTALKYIPSDNVEEESSVSQPLTTASNAKIIKKKKHSVMVSDAEKILSSTLSCQSIIVMPTTNEDEDEEEEDDDDDDEAEQQNGIENIIVAPRSTEIFLDGPFGSPSRHIFQARHAVLIAAGIGVTPFASILQSIMYQYRKSRHVCPNCLYNWRDRKLVTRLQLKKVDFIWLNRNQRSFEWFVSLLSELEIEQAQLKEADRFLDMHMYITSALDGTDMKAVGLQIALDLLYQKEKRCLISGLKSRTQPGRPDWNEVFRSIKNQKKGKVTVFYCGPTQLADVLQSKCSDFHFEFRKEIF